MTEPKRILRPRRTGSTNSSDIPPDVLNWFAAGCPMRSPPWPVLLPPTHAKVAEWWARWKAENPQARPESAALVWLEPSQ